MRRITQLMEAVKEVVEGVKREKKRQADKAANDSRDNHDKAACIQTQDALSSGRSAFFP